MKNCILAILCGLLAVNLSWTQSIGTFTSVAPGTQDSRLNIPGTHAFQLIIENGDPLSAGGTMPDNHDFTGYVPINGSSANGYLGINSELTPGGMTILDLMLSNDNRWIVTGSEGVDFSSFGGTARNCSGAVTPWGTLISCEETTSGDGNGDGYRDLGWAVEVDPVTRQVVDKRWALGNFAHENAVVHANRRTVYQGADSNPGYLYKFVADQVEDLSSGALYVYIGSKNGSGNWVQLANTTQADRNSTLAQCSALGATVFNGVEDVEIGPDGKVYLAVKNECVVYRFDDSDPLTGTTVSNFESFVGGQSYSIDYGTGTASEPWGCGNDNLAFDGDGNLWVLQDGGRNYIWVVRNGHTQASPQVELFGRTPAGSEPTGITFTPDYQYLFMSFQHPSSTNSATTQNDAFGTPVAFDRDISVVIARGENFGPSCPEAGTPCDDGDVCTINDVEDGNCNCAGTFEDDDNDGVCNANDVCPGFNDAADSDNDGIPDGCDSDNCTVFTTDFPENPLVHQGTGSRSTSINFPAGSRDVDFSISNINQKTNGPANRQYSELVTVNYTDGLGNQQQYGIFSGASVSSVNVSIAGEVQTVSVTLTDEIDGDSGASSMSISFSAVQYCQASGPCPDSDGDGVCDGQDLCPGFDDMLDSDGDGIPDGCDDCFTQSDDFPQNPLLHSGPGVSSTTLSFGELREDVVFIIFNIDAKDKGKADGRYTELVTVTYVDANGFTQPYGNFSGTSVTTADITISGPVQSVTVQLEDAYDGDSGTTELRIDFSEVSSCTVGTQARQDLPSLGSTHQPMPVALYPNPTRGRISLTFNTLKNDAQLRVYDVHGRPVAHRQVASGTAGLELDLSTYGAAGIYLVSLEQEGVPLFIRRVVKLD